MKTTELVWAFDLGKASIGEAVREGNKFLHKASLPIPAELSGNKKGLTACAEPRMEVIVCALRRWLPRLFPTIREQPDWF